LRALRRLARTYEARKHEVEAHQHRALDRGHPVDAHAPQRLSSPQQPDASRITYSEFLAEVQSGAVAEVSIQDQQIKGTRTDGSYFETFDPGDPGLVGDLLDQGVTIRAVPPDRPGAALPDLIAWLPFLILIGVWIWFMRRSMGGGGAAAGCSTSARAGPGSTPRARSR
jgi:ATP-dependent Zn protease